MTIIGQGPLPMIIVLGRFSGLGNIRVVRRVDRPVSNAAAKCQAGASIGTPCKFVLLCRRERCLLRPSETVATAMILKSLTLTNFRGIRNLRLDLSEKVNLLAGVNGAGKTAILDCAAIMLSRLVGRIRFTKGTGRFFSEYDITNGTPETQNVIEAVFRGRPCTWKVTKTRRGIKGQTITRLAELGDLVDDVRTRLENDKSASIPIAVYYPVNRAVLDIPLRIRKRHPFDQLSAYDQALSGTSSSFRIFFEWFRDREDWENERRLESRRFRDPQLQSVRAAIERFLPGFSAIRVRRNPLRMVTDKSGEELRVDQLSDGEKCTLAMVGDLARRMAIANPDRPDPLAGEGVVLIDEVDLHLHPGWQRQVVSALEETFPNCQFLVSTHSPQIISHVPPERIWLLERSEAGVRASRPVDSFGQTASRILEDLMHVPDRPQEIKERLSDLFIAIQHDQLPTAKQLLADLTSTIGDDPDLVRAQMHILRKQALGNG